MNYEANFRINHMRMEIEEKRTLKTYMKRHSRISNKNLIKCTQTETYKCSSPLRLITDFRIPESRSKSENITMQIHAVKERPLQKLKKLIRSVKRLRELRDG